MQANTGKYNLLLARSMIVLTALIVWFIFYEQYQGKTETYNNLNQQLKEQVSNFKSLNDKALLAELYEKKFNQFMPIEQYESENRLYWLDQLDAIRVKHNIPKLSYSFSATKPYDYKDGLIKHKGLKVSVSNIRLTMGLLHAGDLVTVLNDLKAIKSSIHAITSCEMQRLNTSGRSKPVPGVPNIEAICNLKWFTFKVK